MSKSKLIINKTIFFSFKNKLFQTKSKQHNISYNLLKNNAL